MSDATRELLRHTLAVVAYRGGKAIRDAPEGFASFCAGPGSRPAGEILAHVGDLFDWALELADGRHVWKEAEPGSWEHESARLFAGLAALDRRLAAEAPLGFPAERLFQGPVADALSHIGQINMLRRLAGAPVRGENYFKAEIVTGQIGPDQSAPRREFD